MSVVAQTCRHLAGEAEKNTKALWLSVGHELPSGMLQRLTEATTQYARAMEAVALVLEER
jgi:hypothetical protein